MGGDEMEMMYVPGQRLSPPQRRRRSIHLVELRQPNVRDVFILASSPPWEGLNVVIRKIAAAFSWCWSHGVMKKKSRYLPTNLTLAWHAMMVPWPRMNLINLLDVEVCGAGCWYRLIWNPCLLWLIDLSAFLLVAHFKKSDPSLWMFLSAIYKFDSTSSRVGLNFGNSLLASYL